MAAAAILAAQLIVGGWFASPWFGPGDVVDVVAFLILGGSLLAGVPGSVLTLAAAARRSPAAAKAAMYWTGVRAVALVAVTAVIVVATDPGPGAQWYIDWELIVLAAVEIAVSYALAHDTLRKIARTAQAQRRMQV